MQTRRETLKQSAVVAGLLAATGLFPRHALAAFNKAAFDAKNVPDAVKAYGGGVPTESKDVMLTAPDIAENGAVVPFTISSKLPNTETIAVLVEKNPSILAARFDIPQGTDPWVNTRVKMGQTSNVFAVVKTSDGKFYYAPKEVKVTLGGCGG